MGNEKTNLGGFHILDDRNRFGLGRIQLACADGLHYCLFFRGPYGGFCVCWSLDGDVMTKYWRPEPKLYGLDFWALLLPAVCYTVGLILFGGEALQAGKITGENQAIGSLLMVIGGEVGSLASASEVFRKHKEGRATFLDLIGLIVSLLATLGILFVVFAKLSDLTVVWIAPVRTWGPLVLLLCSGLDYAANVMEFAFYRAHFDELWNNWNDARHNSEQRAETRAQNKQQPEPETPKLTGLKPGARRAALVDICLANPDANSDELAPMFGVSSSTIRRDVGILEKAGELGDNGRKIPVKVEEAG